MTRTRAVAALSGLAVLVLAACGAAPVSRPLAQTAATQVAQPAKPKPANAPGETIPAGTTAVTLALKPDMNVHVKPPQLATVTDPAKVRQLTVLINGLPVFPPGTYNCPFDGEAKLVLTFSAATRGPVLAVATVSLEGCEGVALTIRGRQQPGLGSPDGGRQDAAQILKTVGLPWDLTRYTGSI